jgi:N-acetylglucosamine-6-phosphate deacetylase
MTGRLGTLSAGAAADLLLLDADLRLLRVLRRGVWIYEG